MAFQLPGLGEQNWGDSLNNWLRQISSDDKGGLNYWTNGGARPRPESDGDIIPGSTTSKNPSGIAFSKVNNDGLTGVNIDTKVIERWDTAQDQWVVVLTASSTNSGTGSPSGNGDYIGETYYDVTNEALYIWDGTNWVEFSAGSSGFSDVTSTTYTTGKLTQVVADGKTYDITYDGDRVDSVTDGANTWNITYTGDELTSVMKT